MRTLGMIGLPGALPSCSKPPQIENPSSHSQSAATYISDVYELVKKIRALKKKDRAKTPAIALTGFAGADDESRAIAAGYQLHVSKPVDLGTLTSEIARLAQKVKGKNLMSRSSRYRYQQ